MNRFYKTLVCFLFATSLLSVKQVTTYDKVIGNWSYTDKFTFKFLKLKKDKTYNYVYSSCRGKRYYEGVYSLQGDTIVLTNNVDNKVKQFLFDESKIRTYYKDGKFSEFEPLKRTRKRSEGSAYREGRRNFKKMVIDRYGK